MNLKTFQADSMQEALAQVRDELGPDAVIVKTRQASRRVLGRQKPCFEVTAAAEGKAPSIKPVVRSPAAPARPEMNAPAKPPAGQYDWSGRLPRVSMHPVPAPVTPPSPDAQPDKMPTREMRMLREEIQTLVDAASSPAPESADWADGMPVELVRELWRRAGSGSGPDARHPDIMARALPRLMADDLRFAGGIRLKTGRPARILFIGPSGSGKTSLIEKLATQARMRGRLRVGILSADPRRFGAHGELTLFAKTLGLPAAGVYGPRELPAALHALRGSEIILADSPSLPSSEEGWRDLEDLRRAFQPDEVHLVFNACMREREMRRTAEACRRLQPTHLSFTRLDECLGFGSLYATARYFPGGLGYLASGSAASSGIETASRESCFAWFTRATTQAAAPVTV